MKANHLPASGSHPARALLFLRSPSTSCSPHSSCWFLPFHLPLHRTCQECHISENVTEPRSPLQPSTTGAPLVPSQLTPHRACPARPSRTSSSSPHLLLSASLGNWNWMMYMDAVVVQFQIIHTFYGAAYCRYNYSYFIDEETGSEMLSNFSKIAQL